MSEHHHQHRKKDGASLFKEKSLRRIKLRKSMEKWAKTGLVALAVIMFIALLLSYYLI
jgi:hypothetical protein